MLHSQIPELSMFCPQNSSKPCKVLTSQANPVPSARGAHNKNTLHLQPSRIALCAMRIEVQAFEIAPCSLKATEITVMGRWLERLNPSCKTCPVPRSQVAEY